VERAFYTKKDINKTLNTTGAVKGSSYLAKKYNNNNNNNNDNDNDNDNNNNNLHLPSAVFIAKMLVRPSKQLKQI